MKKAIALLLTAILLLTDCAFAPRAQAAPAPIEFPSSALAGRPENTDFFILLSPSGARTQSDCVSINGSEITIFAPGSYLLSGEWTGTLIVDVEAEKKVVLCLNGAALTGDAGAAIWVKSEPKNVTLYLCEGSVNLVQDAEVYAKAADEEDAPDAAIYSKEDLRIAGNGALYVSSQAHKGIHSKDDIEIQSGQLFVRSYDDGIRGKDSVSIAGGQVTVEAGADGIRSANGEKEGKGYILISGGKVTVTAEQDGLQAETDLTVSGGSVTVFCGGGSANAPDSRAADNWGGSRREAQFGKNARGRNRSDDAPTAGNAFGRDAAGEIQSDNDTSSEFPPKGAVSDETAPNGNIPSDFPPKGGIPEENAPNDSIFSDAPPKSGIPDEAAPQDGAPPEIAPNVNIPSDIPPKGENFGATPPDSNLPSNGFMFDMTPPGGFEARNAEPQDDEETSAKALKAGKSLAVSGGVIVLDSSDDAIHSNGSALISGGEILVSSGDDAIHADETLKISGGSIVISKSYEGLESAVITVSGGSVRITASDDGINASDGAESSGMNGRPGQNWNRGITSSGTCEIHITGGYLCVNAEGDGIDSNGSIDMSGGTVVVYGPTSNGDGALDYDGTFSFSGGNLLAVGSSGMAQSVTTDANTAVVAFSCRQNADVLMTVTDSDGSEILSFAAPKSYSSVVLAGFSLTPGETCLVYAGGTRDGEPTDGIYPPGQTAQGELLGTFTAR